MTGFAKLIRTTAFRLLASYLLVFILFAGFLFGYIAWNARRVLQSQLTETIETEINSLAEQYRVGGPRRLAGVIEQRSRQARGFFYLLTDPRGEVVAGNAPEILPLMQRAAGWHEVSFDRAEERGAEKVAAFMRLFLLPNGLKLVVGHDLEDRKRMRTVLRQAMTMAIVLVLVLGGVGAYVVSRRVLRPIDNMTDAASRIMAGNLSERLPVQGVGDELDRLAGHLNLMLNRIGELMNGLREVSDNIAHDLRTPLTRMRAAAEQALRTAKTEDEMRGALERTIEESDALIRIFNALLMIARVEAGASSVALSELPFSDIVAGVAELYEPVAEDAGMTLTLNENANAIVHGSRELLSQAAANLVDNAIKYGRAPAGAGGAVTLATRIVDGCIELVVADRGLGVPPEDRERVLDRFVRLEKSRGEPGSGLGLSLVAAIARLHGGRLTLEDNQPGLRAVLSLPVAQPAPGAAA